MSILELLANQISRSFISGMHKSPFHGFSAEFAEHKIYNPGESTKHIDWKLYAKTDGLYTKRYERRNQFTLSFDFRQFVFDALSKLKENPAVL